MIKERKIDPEKFITIPYGVDLKKFADIKSSIKKTEIGLDNGDKVLGVVARFTKQKGHIYLIEAASQIVNKFPNTKFLFVGDGPLRKDLETKINELGLNSKFILLGFRNDVRELLQVFDIFVLPSLWEGLPNVLLEAMACGKPIVATAVDGTPEAVVDGNNGLIVPPKNPDKLADALMHLLQNEQEARKMGKRGRKRVENFYSIEKQMNNFQELYDFCLEQKQISHKKL